MGRDTRIVGERGQITIPKELRERFGIRGGDEVVVRAEDENIVIAQRTVDDRLAEGYREYSDRDRTIARSTFGSSRSQADEPDDAGTESERARGEDPPSDGARKDARGGDPRSETPDDVPAW